MGRLMLRLLGTPEVSHAEHPLTLQTRKVLALLAYLAVEQGVHSRDKITALPWPESDEERGKASLRRALAYLRESLIEPGLKKAKLREAQLRSVNCSSFQWCCLLDHLEHSGHTLALPQTAGRHTPLRTWLCFWR